MTSVQKSILAITSGLFFGISFWLWAQMGDAVFLSKALAYVQSCL